MQNQFLISIPLLAALGIVSCGYYEPSHVAAAGGAPATGTIPVGPVPGPPVAITLPSDPYGQNQVALAEGRQLFLKYNCYGCHGGRGGGGMGPSLRDDVWIFGGDPAHVFSSISEGRAEGMPAWGTMIPQDQIWKLVSYIKSMGTPLEPDAPKNDPAVTPVEAKAK